MGATELPVTTEIVPSSVPVTPDDVFRLLNGAEARHNAGDLAGAARDYRQAIAWLPGIPELYNVLGLILFDRGRFEDTVACNRCALALRPDDAHALYGLANAQRTLGQTDPAIANYHRAIALGHESADTFCNLGVALYHRGDHDAAAAAYRRAIALEQDYAEAYCNLAIVLCDQYQLDEAASMSRRALALQPHYPRALNSLGNALQALGRLEQATAAYRGATTLEPDYAEPLNNLSNLLVRQGRLNDAIAGYRRALVLKPGDPRIHLVYAMALLKQGQLRDGWAEFEWRWFEQAPGNRGLICGKPQVPQPEWTGQPLEGRAILLYTEHGLGDALQFVRYAAILAERGARVVMTVFPGLVRLLRTVPGVAEVVPLTAPMPAFDYHLSMMSVPHVVGTDLDTIPAAIPYVFPDPDAVAAWRGRIAALSGSSSLKVGLAWAGDPRPHNRGAFLMDGRRSMHLDQFAPLGGIPGVTLFSLQKGAPALQARTPPAGLSLIDWTDALSDFADTAALVAALDLVVTVDTSIVHLAGAMGKPVWILSRFDGCWRWLENRDDTPWYPTARLFHQRRPQEWDDVVERVRAELIRTAPALSAPALSAPAP